MFWYSKVAWSEGLFLRQHHLQQHDRYVEKLLDTRTRYLSPYPWGFSALEIDRELAEQNKFGLRQASGLPQDGTPFDLPGTGPHLHFELVVDAGAHALDRLNPLTSVKEAGAPSPY